ncbi:MAG: ABC transporter ATP-binding protein [Alphaproteobacteria bacterium]
MSHAPFEATVEQSAQRLMRRLWRDHVRHYVGLLGVAMVFMVFAAVSTAALAWLMGPIFDNLFAEKNSALLRPVAAGVLAVFVVKGISTFAQAVLMNMVGARIIAELQLRMFGHLMRSDLADFHAAGSGNLVARFTFDVRQLSTVVSTVIVAFGRDAITVVALVVVLFTNDWQLALVTTLLFPASIYPIVKLGRLVRRVSRRMQSEIGQLSSTLSQVFQGIRHVKAYNAQERETARAGRIIWKVASLTQKMTRLGAATHPVMEFLAGLAVVAIILYGGSEVIAGERTPGSFVSFITALLLAYEPVKKLARLNTQLQTGMAAAQRVFGLLDSPPKITDRPDAAALPAGEGRIRLSGVHFAYGPGIPALHGVDIDVPAGQTVALVGPSGAGKSTVLNLIPRFYDVQRGAVSVDGHDVRDVTMRSLRDRIALVSQEVTLFDETVRANIAFGRPDADDGEIEAAARAAAAHDFIRQLPDGYDTVVGEHGVKLSGGQRQRLSIARAMLKNAPILLLDEATSALDTESERQVQAALAQLMVGRTTLMIAHRLSTVKDADLIYVLDDGHVIERGAHRALIAQRGIYARLWSMQTDTAEDRPTADAAAAAD